MGYQYIQPTKVDSPAVGNLSQARAGKKRAHEELKRLRHALKNEPLGGNRHGLMFSIMLATSNHKDWLRMESGALSVIEIRARQLGMTTQKAKRVAA